MTDTLELEKGDWFTLVRSTTPGIGEFVETNRRVGRVYFTPDVHASVIPFVVHMVRQFGLQDTPLVIARGSRRRKGAGSNAELAFSEHKSGLTAIVYYSSQLRLRDKVVIPVGGTTIHASLIKAVLIHELAHIAYPDADAEWVEELAYHTMFLYLVLLEGFELAAADSEPSGSAESSATVYEFVPSADAIADAGESKSDTRTVCCRECYERLVRGEQ